MRFIILSGFTFLLSLVIAPSAHAKRSNKVLWQQENVPPAILGQTEVTTEEGEPVTIQLSHLVVTDPDDTYPEGFTLLVGDGANYTRTDQTVTPVAGFVGTLIVPVQVHDGDTLSALFDFNITVTAKPVNVAPVITGQAQLTTVKNQPLTITFGHLTVTDPDNTYPEGFTLTLQPGLNYSLSGNTITPAAEFVGSIQVQVTVSDGLNTSNSWPLLIEVVNVEELTIIGQNPLQMLEDSVLTLNLTDLIVNDPEKRYPEGFTLKIQSQNNYAIVGNQITPINNFSGSLTVPVSVSNGTIESNVFNVIVTVVPVNDLPQLTGLLTSVGLPADGSPVKLAPDIEITDADDEVLNFAEIGFTSNYQSGSDAIIPEYTSALIHAVFDQTNGILFLIGDAPVSEYVSMIRSIEYQFTASDSIQALFPKQLYFTISDGTDKTEKQLVSIMMTQSFELDIPTVFSPNEDSANDTWKVRSRSGSDLDGQLNIRVYNKKGLLVYEAASLSREWDGKVNGVLLPSDTYYYTIEMNSPSSRKSFKGMVTLLH